MRGNAKVEGYAQTEHDITPESRSASARVNFSPLVSARDWIVATAASQHMTCRREFLCDYEAIPPVNISLPNRTVQAIGKGTAWLKMRTKTGEYKLRLADVLYVPDLATNLFSVTTACSRGAQVSFDNGLCVIRDADGQVVGRAPMIKGLFRLWHKKHSYSFSGVEPFLKIQTGESTQHSHLQLTYFTDHYVFVFVFLFFFLTTI